jgi:hypothetical protein
VSAPEHTPIGARLRERTQPLAPDDESYGYAHATLCEAIGRMLEQVAQVFDPDGDVPPLAPILALELCPDWALPWLAQWVGIRIPSGMSATDARALIGDVSGFARGTPASLRAAVQTTLTDSKTVWFRERDGSPYRLEVVTLTSETPDAAKSLAALLTQKPGGIVLSYRTVVGWDYQQMTTTGGTYAVLKTTYSSYRKLSEHTPGA